jgi:peptidoglycan hydrolase-like protein with peptidoglycan-binding domain
VRARLAPLIALGMALAVALAACGSSGAGDAGNAAAPLTPSAPAASTGGATATAHPFVPPTPPSTTTPPPAGSAAPTPSSAATPTHLGLQPGDKGPQVVALQKRLGQLGFWLSGTDGSFGDTTQQAVLAAQKAAGVGRDGVAGPLTLQALKRGVTVHPRSTSGHWLEIDKSRQLLLIVTSGKVEAILNTSTGSGQAYQQGGQTYTALTPSGQYTIFRQVDRLDPGPLGALWRPKYFNGGIAVHGAGSVPGYPASHGCARLSNSAIDWIWSSGQAPIGTRVWVY